MASCVWRVCREPCCEGVRVSLSSVYLERRGCMRPSQSLVRVFNRYMPRYEIGKFLVGWFWVFKAFSHIASVTIPLH